VRRLYPVAPPPHLPVSWRCTPDRGRPFRSRVLSTTSTASGSPRCRAQPSWRYQTTLRPSAAPGARRRAGGSRSPGSAGGHQGSSGTGACPPWPIAPRSWRHMQDVGHLGGMEIPGPSGAALPLGGAATAYPFRSADPSAVPGPEGSKGSSGHHRRDRRQRRCWRHAAERRTNRTIMQTDPPARHSLIGPFQRVCYLSMLEYAPTDPTLANSPAAYPLSADHATSSGTSSSSRKRPSRVRS
jgi:hypothetical protein